MKKMIALILSAAVCIGLLAGCSIVPFQTPEEQRAAQEAADLYLHEIACMKADAERECERIIAQARKTASGISPAPKVPAVPVPVVRQSEPSRLRKAGQLLRRWKR